MNSFFSCLLQYHTYQCIFYLIVNYFNIALLYAVFEHNALIQASNAIRNFYCLEQWINIAYLTLC